MCFSKAYHFACFSHSSSIRAWSPNTCSTLSHTCVLFIPSKNCLHVLQEPCVCMVSIKKIETPKGILLDSMRTYVRHIKRSYPRMQQHIFVCSHCVYLTTCQLLLYCDLFKMFREQSLSAWPGLVTRNSLTKPGKEKSILWGNFSLLEEEHSGCVGELRGLYDQSLIRSLQCGVSLK